MKIGTAIKNSRIEKGISQLDLANKMGISRTSLSQIETNLKRPSKTTMEKLAEALELPEIYFYLISLEKEDVPEDKKELYDIVFPSIKEMVRKLVF